MCLGGTAWWAWPSAGSCSSRRPREIQIHSLRIEESEKAAEELRPEAGSTVLSVSSGNIFGLVQGGSKRDRIRAELRRLDDEDLDNFVLYEVLAQSEPDVVIDCVNTSTGIAYGDIFRSAEEVLQQLEAGGHPGGDAPSSLLDALYMPRLIRHIQIMYRGMIDAGTGVYVKVGTTGTGGHGAQHPLHPLRGAAEPGAALEERAWPAPSRCSSS